MEKYCATSDVKCTVGDNQTPPSAGLTSNALPEVRKPIKPTDSQTGVSTNNVQSKTSVNTNKDTKDTPHWYALRTTYGREKKAYNYLLSKGVEAFYPILKSVKLVDSKRITIEESRIPNIFFAYGTEEELKTFVYDNVNLPYPPLLLSSHPRWQQNCQGAIGRTRQSNEQPKDNLRCRF